MMRRAPGITDRLHALDRLVRDGRPRSALEMACIERQRNDLRKGHERGLVWREDAAENVSKRLFPSMRLWKGGGAGKRFVPEPWQEECILAPLFGWWRETAEGLRRRFRIGYTEVPRKNAKTTLAAGVGVQGLAADAEPGAKVYAAATRREQASLVFDDARNMIRQSPTLMKACELKAHSIVCPRWNSSFLALSADAHSLHGLDVHRAILDELHAHKTRDVWDVIQTGTPARRNPLIFAITTAGYDRSTICWEQHEYARQILEGHIQDDSYFAYIASAEQEDDPFEPETWRRANPNLGVSVQTDYLSEEAVRAKQSAAYENTFRRLHLNQWTEQAVRWLPMHIWDAAKEAYTADQLEGRSCFAGLDLASTRDVTALVLVFPDESGYLLLPFFWVPEALEDQRGERDRRQVKNWARQGLIRETPGNVTDYAVVRADIEALASKYRIQKIAFDPWQATETAQRLTEAGLEPVEFRQTISNFAEPTKEFERLLLAGKLKHNGDPVLRWMAGNVAVRTDPSGNIRPDKAASSDKIDGLVAAIMGLALAMQGDDSSVYDREGRGFVTLG